MGINDKIASEFGGSLLIGWAFITALSLFLIQLGSFLATQIFGVQQLALGPFFILLGVVAVLTMAISAGLSPSTFTKESWVALAVLILTIAFLSLIFPKLVPSAFEQSFSLLRTTTFSLLNLG